MVRAGHNLNRRERRARFQEVQAQFNEGLITEREFNFMSEYVRPRVREQVSTPITYVTFYSPDRKGGWPKKQIVAAGVYASLPHYKQTSKPFLEVGRYGR